MKQVFAAFIKFQSDLKPVYKGTVNPFFKSRYADLSSIMESILPVLNKHELGISQTCRVAESGTVLQTHIIHSSGESILSEIVLPFNADPQKMGSLISYYKRYMVQAACGVTTSDEDTDGNDLHDSSRAAPSKQEILNLNAKIKEVGRNAEALLKAVNAQFGTNTQNLEDMSGAQYDYALSLFNKGKK